LTKIQQYIIDSQVKGDDKWIGSDAQNQFQTKNFTANDVGDYFNTSGYLNVGDSILFRYDVIAEEDSRAQGTISFLENLSSSVPLANITTFILSKETLKGNDITQYMAFLAGTKVLLHKADNINSFGIYSILSVTPLEEDPTNFFTLSMVFIEGNGDLEEDINYNITIKQLSDETFQESLNNIDRLKFIRYTGSGSMTDVLNAINSMYPYTITGSESWWIKTSQNRGWAELPIVTLWKILDLGQGTYGQGETQLTAENLLWVNSNESSLNDMLDDPTTEIIEINTELIEPVTDILDVVSVVDMINAYATLLTVKPLAQGHTIFRIDDGTTTVHYWWVGETPKELGFEQADTAFVADLVLLDGNGENPAVPPTQDIIVPLRRLIIFKSVGNTDDTALEIGDKVTGYIINPATDLYELYNEIEYTGGDRYLSTSYDI